MLHLPVDRNVAVALINFTAAMTDRMSGGDKCTLHTRQNGIALAFSCVKLHTRRKRKRCHLALAITVQAHLGLQIARRNVEIHKGFDGVGIFGTVRRTEMGIGRTHAVGNTGLVCAAFAVCIGEIEHLTAVSADEGRTGPRPCDITARDRNVQRSLFGIILQGKSVVVPCVSHTLYPPDGNIILIFQNFVNYSQFRTTNFRIAWYNNNRNNKG